MLLITRKLLWSAGVLLPLLRCLHVGGTFVEARHSKAAARPPHSKSASCACCSSRGQLRFDVRLKRFDAWRNRFAQWEVSRNCVRSLESVARDANHGRFVGMNAPLTNQFLRYASGDAACGFRKNAFCFGEELDRANNLHIRNIFSPAA